MKVVVSLMLGFIILFASIEARTVYVNGATGCDTCDTNTGKVPDKAFKTIMKGVEAAGDFDQVTVAGKFNGKKIIYREEVVVAKEKAAMKIIGVDEPILDGAPVEKEEIEGAGEKGETPKLNTAFCLKADLAVVKNFIVRNYLDDGANPAGKTGGAAVIVDSSAKSATISGFTIENCNWGIILKETQVCKINSNGIKDIKSLDGKPGFDYGGTAIAAIGDSADLQGNLIGKEGANTIDNCDAYGIAYYPGNRDVKCDFSFIENNQIKNAGIAGILIKNVTGSLNVKSNMMKNCKVGLEISGETGDYFYDENLFVNSTSGVEISAEEEYDSEVLYFIWKTANNQFSKDTYVAVDSKTKEIVPINGRYCVFNDEEKAKAVLGGVSGEEDSVIEEKKANADK